MSDEPRSVGGIELAPGVFVFNDALRLQFIYNMIALPCADPDRKEMPRMLYAEKRLWS